VAAASPGTALAASCATCHDCGLLCRLPGHGAHGACCPRCGAPVHTRKVGSLERTWAFLIAAAVCYLPANMLPVMKITSLGKGEASTIMGGVIYLFHHDWPLAVIVFTASVFVPVLKIAILCFLLVSVHRRSRWRPAERTRLYRITEMIGRWSMVDIFVVTILVALVRLGSLASIDAKPGAVFFGAVVVLTMLAAESFDPRLIWDTSRRSRASVTGRRA
jgi:paraquat-inducible protein A